MPQKHYPDSIIYKWSAEKLHRNKKERQRKAENERAISGSIGNAQLEFVVLNVNAVQATGSATLGYRDSSGFR